MSVLHLYTDRSHPIDIPQIKSYIEESTEFDVSSDEYFFRHYTPSAKMAMELARLKVTDFSEEDGVNSDPTSEDASIEERYLQGGEVLSFDVGHVYEGFGFTEILRRLLEPKSDEYHIIITSRMLATWERNRYHGRAIICSLPLSVISTTGMVEAPVKPKEYYVKLMAREKAHEMGLSVPEAEDFEDGLRKEFADRILSYDDRLTEALKGYVLQAIAYFLTYDAFCQDPDCRLYNAHTQEELIHAQLESGKICKTHREIFGNR